MREIEVKLRAKNFKKLEQNLKRQGVKLSAPIYQHDVIYLPPSLKFNHFKSGDSIVRIRRMKHAAQLNLKQQRSGELDNLEFESEISDPEAIHGLLQCLGWKPVVEVKKVRRKGKLGKLEICLDKVERLGTFVELEKLTSDNADPKKVREELFHKLESLGLSRKDEVRQGYDTQVFHLKKK